MFMIEKNRKRKKDSMVFTNDITKRVKVQSLMASNIYIYIKKKIMGFCFQP